MENVDPVVKRPKEEIDDEYRRCAVQFGDREYKIKCLKHALEPLEKEAALLFHRMNEINQEVARDYPESTQFVPGGPKPEPEQPSEPLPPAA